MSQPSPNLAPTVSSVPWANPDTASPTAAPGDRYGYNIREVFADGGYTSPKPITNPMAKIALWFGVFGFFGFTLVISIVLAVIALVQAQSLPERIGSREAIAALVYDGILVFIGLSIYVLGLF